MLIAGWNKIGRLSPILPMVSAKALPVILAVMLAFGGLLLPANRVHAQTAGAPNTLPTINPGDGPTDRIIAFMLQEQPAALDISALRESIAALLPTELGEVTDFVDPENPATEADATSILSRAKEAFPLVEGAEPALFRVYDTPILMVPTAVPVPRQEFASAWQARRQFATAPEILTNHQGHTILFALVDPQSTAEQVRAAEAVSAVISGALALENNIQGIHWSAANMAVPPQAFAAAFNKAREEAVTALAEEAPVKPVWHQLITMWIDIEAITLEVFQGIYAEAEPGLVPTDVPAGAVGLVTSGLASFIGREVEMVPSERPPNEQALALVHVLAYLLDQGQVFRDGDTLGFGSERLIQANLLDSSALVSGAAETPGEVPVLRLVYRVGAEDETGALAQ